MTGFDEEAKEKLSETHEKVIRIDENIEKNINPAITEYWKTRDKVEKHESSINTLKTVGSFLFAILMLVATALGATGGI